MKSSTDDPRVALLKELADPLRLRVVDRLGHGGPATSSRLAAELDVPLPQLSNHLRRLREAGLVTVERSGRQATYALADPGLEVLLPLLDRITGRVAAPTAGRRPTSPSRTCYDHLGGRHRRRRSTARCASATRCATAPDGTVELGPAAPRRSPPSASTSPRSSPAAGGSRSSASTPPSARRTSPARSADALAAALDRAQGWIEREPGGRTIRLTRGGREGAGRAHLSAASPRLPFSAHGSKPSASLARDARLVARDRLLTPAEHRGQVAEQPLRGAVARDRPARREHAAGVRQQPLVDRRRRLRVAEQRARLGQLSHRRGPVGVERQPGEAVRGHQGELLPRLLGAAVDGERPRVRGAPRHRRRARPRPAPRSARGSPRPSPR